jgi:nuclear transcription Y subunit beta
MSSTPPKKDGVEPPQSPDDDQHMDRNAEDTQAQGLGYEFEVKEQDRWLPIANGAYLPFAHSNPPVLPVA